MAREVRQIGVMKTLGAGPNQVAGLYLTTVGVLGGLAILIALPTGYVAARAYAGFGAAMLNFNIFNAGVPLPYWLLQIGLGAVLPLAVAAFPVLRASRITIREAISDYGVSARPFGRSWYERLLARIRFLPRLALLAIRNTFRRRMRAFLTVLTLMAAGTSFITAMNVYASMNGTVDAKFNAIRYDTVFFFNRPYPLEPMRSEFQFFPGASQVEFWGGANAAVVRADGSVGNSFQLVAPSAGTDLMAALPVTAGRWLLPDDRNALVVNQLVLSNEPEIRVGQTLRLRIGGRESEWIVVGTVNEMMAPPTAYANLDGFNVLTGLGDSTGFLVFQSQDRSREGVTALTRNVEARMDAMGIDIATSYRLADLREIIINHLLILATFLVMMSVLVLVVGGLGLASTLSINILERRREIGVMRAIGASGWDVTRLVAGEGMMIGLIGWILALLASGPVGRWITWTFGMTFFQTPLEFSYSVSGVFLWLGVVILFATGASLIPAYDASRMPVQEALAYE
jgi:putative ABC transport system permease protein